LQAQNLGSSLGTQRSNILNYHSFLFHLFARLRSALADRLEQKGGAHPYKGRDKRNQRTVRVCVLSVVRV
jgi:hypothetical protein